MTYFRRLPLPRPGLGVGPVELSVVEPATSRTSSRVAPGQYFHLFAAFRTRVPVLRSRPGGLGLGAGAGATALLALLWELPLAAVCAAPLLDVAALLVAAPLDLPLRDDGPLALVGRLLSLLVTEDTGKPGGDPG